MRRSEGRAILEGPHLLAALLERGLRPIALLATEEALKRTEIRTLAGKARIPPTLLAPRIFESIAEAETPQGIAAEIEIPDAAPARGDTVFLEGVQDAGNVGAIIRSAAAFGIAQVVLDRACADPWSPKVLRAGMGGHFALSVRQVQDLKDELGRFKGQLLCTAARDGVNLKDAKLSRPLGWIFGSEGKGLSAEVQKLAALRLTIPVGGVESLNVAAAAAICLYESASRPAAGS